MQIWVDADACPNVIKDILFRAADRWKVQVTLVANQLIRVPPSSYIRALQVPAGFDVADEQIVQRIEPGDLVITADIPLANDVLNRGAVVLHPRGERLDANTIRERLQMRDFLDTLRASGVDTGGPPPLSNADRQTFAGQLDSLLQRHASGRSAGRT